MKKIKTSLSLKKIDWFIKIMTVYIKEEFRIYVNRELDVIDLALDRVVNRVSNGGLALGA
ncbi:MAG: hypothetical protein IIZ87_05870 [Selenomonas sp.]|nr:hypothetical protein [Selenomonas sp.]